MKYLNEFNKFFESLEVTIVSDIKDILLEIEDDNYKTKIYEYSSKLLLSIEIEIEKNNGEIKIDEIKDCLERILDYTSEYDKLYSFEFDDYNFSSTDHLYGEGDTLIFTIDINLSNSKLLDLDKFEKLKKERTLIPKGDIIKISNILNNIADHNWLRGWKAGVCNFSIINGKNITEELSNKEAVLLMIQVSLKNVSIIDLNIYHLKTGQYLLDGDKYGRRYYLSENINKFLELLSGLTNEYIDIAATNYEILRNQ
jgi:hypothetical protein